MTFKPTPSCPAGVGTVVAVTTTGSTFFVSCAAEGAAVASISITTIVIACLTTAPSLSKGRVCCHVADRSPDSWLFAAARPSRDSHPVASLTDTGVAPHSQWRDRAGFSPASLDRDSSLRACWYHLPSGHTTLTVGLRVAGCLSTTTRQP